MNDADRSYLAQLRAAAAAAAQAPSASSFDSLSPEHVMSQARDLVPKILKAQTHGLHDTRVPAAHRLPRPRDVLPPPTQPTAKKRTRADFERSESLDSSSPSTGGEGEDDNDDGNDDALSVDTTDLAPPPSAAQAPFPQNGISWSFNVPHTQANLEDVFVPYHEALEDVEKLIRYFRRRPRPSGGLDDRCFLCEYGNPTYDRDPDYGCRTYTNMVNFFCKNYGTAKNDAIANGLQTRFEKGIDEPYERFLQQRGLVREDLPFGIPRMTSEKFQAHIEDMHTLNSIIIIGEGMRSLLGYQRLLEHRLVDKETQHYDPKALDGLIKIAGMKLKYATVNLKHANYNQGQADGLVLDPAKVQAMASVNRIESLLVTGGSFIGGQTASDSTLTTGDTRRTHFQLEGTTSRDRDEASDLRALRDLMNNQSDAMDIDEPVSTHT